MELVRGRAAGKRAQPPRRSGFLRRSGMVGDLSINAPTSGSINGPTAGSTTETTAGCAVVSTCGTAVGESSARPVP